MQRNEVNRTTFNLRMKEVLSKGLYSNTAVPLTFSSENSRNPSMNYNIFYNSEIWKNILLHWIKRDDLSTSGAKNYWKFGSMKQVLDPWNSFVFSNIHPYLPNAITFTERHQFGRKRQRYREKNCGACIEKTAVTERSKHIYANGQVALLK